MQIDVCKACDPDPNDAEEPDPSTFTTAIHTVSQHNSPPKDTPYQDNEYPPTNTPVTLSYFLASRRGGGTHFEWSTATETGNLGFNLYVEADGQPVPINKELILSQMVDSLEPVDYAYDAVDLTGMAFFIEDVNVLGETNLHGPFALGVAYGSRAGLGPVNVDDWVEYIPPEPQEGPRSLAPLVIGGAGARP
jgi:hypothetical protein